METMTSFDHDQHDNEQLEEELDAIKNSNKRDSFVGFYEKYQVQGFELCKKKNYREDEFVTDLSSLNDEDLLILHQNSNWVAPSYFLRLRYHNKMDELSEEMLMMLIECRSKKARAELYRRYQNNLQQASDEILVLLSQDGDEDALVCLIERFKSYVSKVIRRLEKKFFFRGFDSDDLFQEGILGLFKSKDDFKIERKTKFRDFSKYVIEKHIGTLILRSSNYKNKVLNESFSYHSPIGTDSEITFEQLLTSNASQPEERCIKKDMLETIREKLTDLEDDVLDLYDQGLSYKEIGELVGKEKKAVDNTIQRIRNKGDAYLASQLVAEGGYTYEEALALVKKWRESRRYKGL